MTIGGFSVLVHGEAGIADRIASGELFRVFRIAFVERDHSVTLVNIFYQVIYCIHIVALVAQEGTLLNGNDIIGSREYFLNDGRVRHIGRGGQFINGQAGNAVTST